MSGAETCKELMPQVTSAISLNTEDEGALIDSAFNTGRVSSESSAVEETNAS